MWVHTKILILRHVHRNGLCVSCDTETIVVMSEDVEPRWCCHVREPLSQERVAHRMDAKRTSRRAVRHQHIQTLGESRPQRGSVLGASFESSRVVSLALRLQTGYSHRRSEDSNATVYRRGVLEVRAVRGHGEEPLQQWSRVRIQKGLVVSRNEKDVGKTLLLNPQPRQKLFEVPGHVTGATVVPHRVTQVE
uniref:Uncharacterized protein n=1 Tax=Noctiluca scintillans TaxID=2966 RepID=A0A7S1AJ37_NOCSC